MAATVAPAMAASTKRNVSPARSKAWTPPAKRRIASAASKASRVFPAAMPSEVSAVPAVVRLTRKAATNTLGHRPAPPTSSAASAMPLAGHTALALVLPKASESPSLPATKYAAASSASCAGRGSKGGRRPFDELSLGMPLLRGRKAYTEGPG